MCGHGFLLIDYLRRILRMCVLSLILPTSTKVTPAILTYVPWFVCNMPHLKYITLLRIRPPGEKQAVLCYSAL